MKKRWLGGTVLAVAMAAFGCTETTGPIGGSGGSGTGGNGGGAGMGGMGDLCMDVDCSDENDCTEDVCNPADGSCSNPSEEDGTVCEFGPDLGGVCMSGVCEDAMLCSDAGTRCDDENECTIDECDPLDGACISTNEENGTACDAAGNAGICRDGTCVRDCSLVTGLDVSLPTSGTPTETYTDLTNGFTLSAPIGQVTFSPFGVGANANGSALGFDANDRLIVAFVDSAGGASSATAITVGLSSAGVAGTVEVIADGGGPMAVSVSPGGSIYVAAQATQFEIRAPDGDPVQIYWETLSYIHDCL